MRLVAGSPGRRLEVVPLLRPWSRHPHSGLLFGQGARTNTRNLRPRAVLT
jgi:hypothetical protein